MRFTSATPPTRARSTSTAPPTRARLTLAGLFFIVKLILVKTNTVTAFLVLQTAPLNFMTRRTVRIRFLGHIIMISQ
ncbi:hypothetical protein B9K03_10000 [Rothia sp. Olga]|nr:hypothetical protein B9K03_10000 [Rothia sp. Olga]